MFLILLAACTDAPPADTVQTDDTAPAGPVAAETVGGLRPMLITVECGDGNGEDRTFTVPEQAPVAAHQLLTIVDNDDGQWISQEIPVPPFRAGTGGPYTSCGTQTRDQTATATLLLWFAE